MEASYGGKRYFGGAMRADGPDSRGDRLAVIRTTWPFAASKPHGVSNSQARVIPGFTPGEWKDTPGRDMVHTRNF